MNPGEQAFLNAVIARPDDDLPRLIYADWLEENAGGALCPGCSVCVRSPELRNVNRPLCGGTGEVSNGYADRAEFIRVQIKRAELEAGLDRGYGGRGVKGKGVNAINALRRRERELLDAASHPHLHDGGKWLPSAWPFDAAKDGTRLRWDWHRGFVESLSMPWQDWRTHADAIRKATPLRKVRLTDWPTLRYNTPGNRPALDMNAPGHQRVGDPGPLPDVMRELLGERWPTVEFELPPWQETVLLSRADDPESFETPEMRVMAIPGMRSRPHFVMSLQR